METETRRSGLELHDGPYFGFGAICLFFGSLSVAGGPVLVFLALGSMSPPPVLVVGAIEFSPEESAPIVIVFGIALFVAGLGAILCGLCSITHQKKMVFDDQKRRFLYHYTHVFRRVQKEYDYSDIVGIKFAPDATEDDVGVVGMRFSIAFSNHDELEIGIREDPDTVDAIAAKISELTKVQSIGNG